MKNAILCTILLAIALAQTVCSAEDNARRVVSLNGTWWVCQANDKELPPASAYKSTVPVPGLVDMAKPAFPDVGTKQVSVHGISYWYRRTFTIDGDVPSIAKLKIAKVKYGCSAYLNGQQVGDGARCFTPHYFDVSASLKGNGAVNELVVRIGASRQHSMCRDVFSGADKEKTLYIAGIYDSVDLILANGPFYIDNVQTAMDPATKTLIISPAILNYGEHNKVQLRTVVREVATGKVVAEGYDVQNRQLGMIQRKGQEVLPGQRWIGPLRVDIDNPRLWSPEDPFLYELELTCSAMNEPDEKGNYDLAPSDRTVTRFGMRDFRIDSKTGAPYLNGKPYYLRGTNICIFRFFEDPDRGDKPWDKEWVRKVIRSFKAMNWNSCRYCIGFPPEIWYEVADEEGLLIQDEYPIWSLWSWPRGITEDKLVPCFRAWMRERWNHPCVVIWDSQNETLSYRIAHGVAARVRGEDLSIRPWDFGWEDPMLATDVKESHLYYFKSKTDISQFPERFADLGRTQFHYRGRGEGFLCNKIINEYGWLWLNRRAIAHSGETRLARQGVRE